jgi:hypothetical protein
MLTQVATNRDGALLQEMMATAPQASGGLPMTHFTAPNFFGRARMYEESAVVVADAWGDPVGSAAVAIRASPTPVRSSDCRPRGLASGTT